MPDGFLFIVSYNAHRKHLTMPFKGAYDGHYKNLRMGIERIIYPNHATDYRPEDNLQTIRVPSVASITRSKGLRMDKR